MRSVARAIVGLLFLLSVGIGAASAQVVATPKAKRPMVSNAAGVVSGPQEQFDKRTIYGNMTFGVECVTGQSTVTHSLGWIPENTAITVDFESGSNSDPVAALNAIKFENGNAGGERFSSDDDGGNLNPYFRLMKPYSANWLLTIGSANGGVACYSFKVTLQ